MLMGLVVKLRFLNEYGELETVKPGYQVKDSAGASVGSSGTGLVLIFSFLYILFMFTGENGLVCCFCPDCGIWESGIMLEVRAVAAETVGAGAAIAKTAASRLTSLLRYKGLSVASLQALLFILLVFHFSVPVFCST